MRFKAPLLSVGLRLFTFGFGCFRVPGVLGVIGDEGSAAMGRPDLKAQGFCKRTPDEETKLVQGFGVPTLNLLKYKVWHPWLMVWLSGFSGSGFSAFSILTCTEAAT